MNSLSPSDNHPMWKRKIKMLGASAWQDAKINESHLDAWLRNFTGAVASADVEQSHAFHLLHQFLYFGKQEVYEALRVLFRDCLLYKITQQARDLGVGVEEIGSYVNTEVFSSIRFVGIGHASESGQSFLYHFRVANALPTYLFISESDIPSLTDDAAIKEIIFIDDFCGSGSQIKDRLEEKIDSIRRSIPNVTVSCYLLFATAEGIRNASNLNIFDSIDAAVQFDDDYKAFATSSPIFHEHPIDIEQKISLKISEHYGGSICPSAALGYNNCQLLVGFEHNTPDNTLPIFWARDSTLPWRPIFPRANKF